MSTPSIHRCLEAGLAILVGTVDAQGTPSTCRGIAVAPADAADAITAYVPVATSQDVIRNIALTKRIALAASHPISHRSTQVKGVAIDARLAREDEAPYVRERLEAFAEVLDKIGVPRRVTRSVAHWPAFAVTIKVEQIFDQTPGPNAGARIQ